MARRKRGRGGPPPPVKRSPAELTVYWESWLSELYEETLTLTSLDDFFWAVNAATNSSTSNANRHSLFIHLLKEQYERSMLVGLRSLTDHGGQQNRSVVNLLLSIQESCESVITRERYGTFFSSDLDGEWNANFGFDHLAGRGASFLSKAVIQERIKWLEAPAATCRAYATHHIAHRLASEKDIQKPSPEEWRKALMAVWDTVRWITWVIRPTQVERRPMWARSPYGFVTDPILKKGEVWPAYESAQSLAGTDPLALPTVTIGFAGPAGTEVGEHVAESVKSIQFAVDNRLVHTMTGRGPFRSNLPMEVSCYLRLQVMLDPPPLTDAATRDRARHQCHEFFAELVDMMHVNPGLAVFVQVGEETPFQLGEASEECVEGAVVHLTAKR